MIDVFQWRASIGLWHYCQAASSRPANGRQCHSFKGAIDSQSGSITSLEKTTKLPAAIPIIALFLLYLCYPIPPPPPPTGIANFYSLVLSGATAVGSSSNLICFFLSLIVRLLLLLSGDVELNPGPTIYDKPDVSLLIQWLDALPDWIEFALILPEITRQDVFEILFDYRKVEDQKLALYSKWLNKCSYATWRDVYLTLKFLPREYNNYFAGVLKRNLEESTTDSAPVALGQPVTIELPQKKVMFETAEDEKEILRKLIELNREFSRIVMHVRSGLKKKNKSDPELLVYLTSFIEDYMDWNDKLTNASLDEIFKIIHPFYDFINFSLIEVISEEFLEDNKFYWYSREIDILRDSVKVKHLIKALEAIYAEHISDISNMPTISIKFYHQWDAHSIKGLSLLIQNLLPDQPQQSLMKYITIDGRPIANVIQRDKSLEEKRLENSITMLLDSYYTRDKKHKRFLANVGISFFTDKGLRESVTELGGSFTTDKGLKESITKLAITCINMHGPPGSGKTCTQCLLLNEAPPNKAITDSTPIACRAIKATKADAHDDTWQKIDSIAMLERLKFELQKAAYSAQKETYSAQKETYSAQKETYSAQKETYSTQKETYSTQKESTDDDDEQQTESITEVNTSSSITSTNTITSNTSEAKSTATLSAANDSNVTHKEIVELLSKVNATTTLSDHMMYIIDSGGQPAFQELMPLFTRRTSLNIITIDLDCFKNPEDKLPCHFRHDGESFLIDSDIKTYQEFVKKAICSSTSSEEPPQCFVLGTRKDKVKIEDIEKAEEVLMSILKSLSEEQQLI